MTLTAKRGNAGSGRHQCLYFCPQLRWHRRGGFGPKRARQAIAAIQESAQLVRPKETIHLITEDEPDNRILECALEAQADVVITGDKHLRQLKTFRGILIVSPGEFLETHRAGPNSS